MNKMKNSKSLFHKFLHKNKNRSNNDTRRPLEKDDCLPIPATTGTDTGKGSSSTTTTNRPRLETSPSTDSDTSTSSPTEQRKSTKSATKMSSRHHKKEDDVALADKEMEERANRAKELLSMRYKGMRHEQVSRFKTSMTSFTLAPHSIIDSNFTLFLFRISPPFESISISNPWS
jgi:hypothetical protein